MLWIDLGVSRDVVNLLLKVVNAQGVSFVLRARATISPCKQEPLKRQFLVQIISMEREFLAKLSKGG